MIQMLCLLLSVIFALLATANLASPQRFQFFPFALAMLALSFLVGALPALH